MCGSALREVAFSHVEFTLSCKFVSLNDGEAFASNLSGPQRMPDDSRLLARASSHALTNLGDSPLKGDYF